MSAALHELTLAELARLLEAGEVSARELARHFLDRIRRLDPALNSFITVTEAQAEAQAERADARRARGEAGPLTGLPIAHKDIFCTEGVRTSCGSRMLEGFVARLRIATVTARLAAAGAVAARQDQHGRVRHGLVQRDQFITARCATPGIRDRVPGGSSGGSAAAVAARLAPAATGTDTGGSIRQPAAFCGITGLKADLRPACRAGA
ncbi:MAG: hypothetical protein KatS3mg121_1022 [Gammaproteobacteria bacterium]|nr:MAG: hypothetical protein KatS3mg121_1022 [Gammaproteobacteria bacterium]